MPLKRIASRVRTRTLAPMRAEADALRSQISALAAEVREHHTESNDVRTWQRQRYEALRRITGREGWDPRDLLAYEDSVFSQNGEDGVLHEILHRVGVERRFFVEIGADATEANCILLADAFGWTGRFVDGDPASVAAIQRRYRGIPRVQAVEAFVNAANINEVLHDSGVPREPDVLSIDVDGNDYWLWKACAVSARVVIIEYNSLLDSGSRLVQPYVRQTRPWDGTGNFGSSLGALRSLGREKGYRLVHAGLAGVNLFFVREDLVGEQFLPEGDVADRPSNLFLAGLAHTLEPAPDWEYEEV